MPKQTDLGTGLALAAILALSACKKQEEPAPSVAAVAVELVALDDDAPDVVGDSAGALPKGFARFVEAVPLATGEARGLSYVRVVTGSGEAIDATFERARKWAEALALPPGDRFVYGHVLELDEARKKVEAVGVRTFIAKKTPLGTASDVKEAKVVEHYGEEREPAVELTLGGDALTRLRAVTKDRAITRIAVLFDGKVQATPMVVGNAEDGKVAILLAAGDALPAVLGEAKRLALGLKGRKVP